MKKAFLKRTLLSLLMMLPVLLMVSVHAQGSGTRYKGIDVSKYEGQINWSEVKSAGVQFAMIRTGYGGDDWNSQTDPYFESNYAGAAGAGIKVGVYHYSYAVNVSMAEEEADFCLHILNGRHLDYPVAYDVEDPSQSGVSADTMAQIVQAFCSRIQQGGYRAIVYSYVTFYNSKLTSPLVSQYDTWIANYTSDPAPHFSRSYTMWQYTSSGSVPGISGACDLDYSYADYSGSGGSPDPSTASSSASSAAPLDPMTFLCDTPSYTFGSNGTYVYKITTPDTCPPTAVSSNPSAVSVSSAAPTASGFLFTLTNAGPGQATITTTAGDGRSVSFVAEGNAAAQATVLQCDTSSYTFGSNSVYFYKITTDAALPPAAVSSDPSAVPVSYARKLPDGYLYRIANAGSGTAVITTTALGGMSVSFAASGNG